MSTETTNVEVTKVPTKAELAMAIYTEVEGVRAEFIKRCIEELGMSKAGASTYHQNCKIKAGGGKVKSYYKSKKARDEHPEEGQDLAAVVEQVEEK